MSVKYRIAGNFRGTKYSWLELALQVKVGKVASFVGEIFVVRPPTTKTTNTLPHENYTLYGILVNVSVQCPSLDPSPSH